MRACCDLRSINLILSYVYGNQLNRLNAKKRNLHFLLLKSSAQQRQNKNQFFFSLFDLLSCISSKHEKPIQKEKELQEKCRKKTNRIFFYSFVDDIESIEKQCFWIEENGNVCECACFRFRLLQLFLYHFRIYQVGQFQ